MSAIALIDNCLEILHRFLNLRARGGVIEGSSTNKAHPIEPLRCRQLQEAALISELHREKHVALLEEEVPKLVQLSI